MGFFDSLKKKAKQFGLGDAVDAMDAIDSVKKSIGNLNGGNLKKKIGGLGLLDDIAGIAEEFGLNGTGTKAESATSKPAPASATPAPKLASVPISMEEIGKYVEEIKGVKKVYISDKLVIGYTPVFSTTAGDVLVEPALRISLNEEGVKVEAEFSLKPTVGGRPFGCDDYQCRIIKAGLSVAAGNLYDKDEYKIFLGIDAVVRVWRQFRDDDLKTDDLIKKTILLGINALIKETPDAGNLLIRSINNVIKTENSDYERWRLEAEQLQERVHREVDEQAARKRREEEARRRAKVEDAERKRREEEARRRAEVEEAERKRRRGLNKSFTYTLRKGGTVRGLQDAFTEDYPYLRIGVYMVKTGQKADKSGGEITSYDKGTTFGDIRSFKGECEVEISGSDTPKDLEAHFRKVSGLVIKICYNDENDHRYYIANDEKWYTMPIYDIDRAFRGKGYKTADIS